MNKQPFFIVEYDLIEGYRVVGPCKVVRLHRDTVELEDGKTAPMNRCYTTKGQACKAVYRLNYQARGGSHGKATVNNG